MTDTSLPSLEIKPSKKRTEAESYLLSKHNLLSSFHSVEDLATDEATLPEADRQGLLHTLVVLRSALARTLWSAGIYVGVSVLDEFVLNETKTGQPDICGRVMQALRQAGASRAGFLLYPLVEFGLEIPIFGSSPTLKPMAIFSEANFAVSAQANSFDLAFDNLKKMAQGLGITASIDRSDIEHHVRAGHMKWFTNNPQMLVRLASHTGDYYENQFIYTLKVRIAAAQIVMLHALSIDAGVSAANSYTSADLNNFETLDIRHYLIGEGTAAGDAPLNVRRVPMNIAALDLARLSDLAVTLSTKTLNRDDIRALAKRITPVLSQVESGYLKYVNLSTGEKVHSRVYRRLLTALDWYRQSFGSRVKESEAIVALAVAFETLLTDHYAPGSAERIARRVEICLIDNLKLASYQASVRAVYYARSAVVHTGESDPQTEIREAQAAFVHCFCELTSRLVNLTRTMVNPIQELLGDALSKEESPAKTIC